jgi:hypothetical protein
MPDPDDSPRVVDGQRFHCHHMERIHTLAPFVYHNKGPAPKEQKQLVCPTASFTVVTLSALLHSEEDMLVTRHAHQSLAKGLAVLGNATSHLRQLWLIDREFASEAGLPARRHDLTFRRHDPSRLEHLDDARVRQDDSAMVMQVLQMRQCILYVVVTADSNSDGRQQRSAAN